MDFLSLTNFLEMEVSILIQNEEKKMFEKSELAKIPPPSQRNLLFHTNYVVFYILA